MAFSYLMDIRGMMFSCFLLAAQSRCVDALPRECLLPLPLLRGLHYFLQCLVDVVVCQPMCDWCITCQKNSTAVILPSTCLVRKNQKYMHWHSIHIHIYMHQCKLYVYVYNVQSWTLTLQQMLKETERHLLQAMCVI